MMKIGLCCISLDLKDQGYSFQTMTYKRFASLPRQEALTILGERILNNLQVTNETIRYCGENDWCYRVSSDLFPLITYDEAAISLEDLPHHDQIQDEFDSIEQTIIDTGVRVSCHPSEYNVLASNNQAAVDKTITELNFFSSFFDRIGLPASYDSPMNIHIQNKNGSYDEIIGRFITNFNRLDTTCQQRIIVENDDKAGCWSVDELVTIFHPRTNIPITFDYLHHKCYANGLDEETAINRCHETWRGYTPLFHYSESAPGNNPRKHADYATQPINTYGLDFDLDFELKGKCKAIKQWESKFLQEMV
jgi:UV DNA damage endonuclease